MIIKKKENIHLGIHIITTIYQENRYDLSIEFADNFVLWNCTNNILGDVSYVEGPTQLIQHSYVEDLNSLVEARCM